MSQVDNVINELAGAANGLLSGSVSERMRLDVAVRNAIDTLLDLTDPAKFYGSALFWRLVPEGYNYVAVCKNIAVAFVSKPKWYPKYEGWSDGNGFEQICRIPHPDPANSLIARPRFDDARKIEVGSRVETDFGEKCRVIGIHENMAWLQIEGSEARRACPLHNIAIIFKPSNEKPVYKPGDLVRTPDGQVCIYTDCEQDGWVMLRLSSGDYKAFKVSELEEVEDGK